MRQAFFLSGTEAILFYVLLNKEADKSASTFIFWLCVHFIIIWNMFLMLNKTNSHLKSNRFDG